MEDYFIYTHNCTKIWTKVSLHLLASNLYK